MKTKPPFKSGQRIKLINMPDDPNPVPAGSLGTVVRVEKWDEKWHVVVTWDNNASNLSLVVPPDTSVVIS